MTQAALTLDAGALIAYERAKVSIRDLLKAAHVDRRGLIVPAVVVAEAWRGGPRSARIARLLAGCRVDPLFDEHARDAGAALRFVRSGTTIDAIVVATAARYRTAIVTTDPDDLAALAAHFGGLPIIPV